MSRALLDALRRVLARRAGAVVDEAAEPATRLPVNPTREIGAGGLPVAPGEPFRTSLRGGSDDLREALRMRAKEAGWAPVFRGMEEPFDGAFRGNPDNWYPDTLSVSRSPDAASFYARKTTGSVFGEGANVMPLQVRGPFAPVQEFEALMSQRMKGGRWTKQKNDAAARAAIAELKRRGYTGIESPVDGEIALFPNEGGGFSNVRSRFAAFDPARAGESDLLAGLGLAGAGLGGGFMLRELLRDRFAA